MKRTRKFWTDRDLWRLIALYPDSTGPELERRLGRTKEAIYGMSQKLGLEKSAEHLSSIPHRTGMISAGAPFRYPRGHIPANKGLRRPGYAPGRMRETMFKKGHFPANRDPDFYVPGALRVNTDGYIDMRTSFGKGGTGWTPLHRVLWEDAHGPVPRGFAVTFKDGDALNVELQNLQLISRAELMKRNSIHNLPHALKSTINVLGQLKRRIREKQDRRSAQSPVRHA
jgi:hypothetical protein